MSKIKVLDVEIGFYNKNNHKYISLTDLAKKRGSIEPRFTVRNWLRNKDTIEFLGIWESIYNVNFNRAGFDTVKSEVGFNHFTISPSSWIKKTNAIGMITRSGRYNSGTYAHEDIALEFASWISAEFKIYLILEFRRLKKQENNISWNVRRELAKINYELHTDAIRNNLIPPELSKEQ